MKYTADISLSVNTDHPTLKALTDAVETAPEGSAQRRGARAELLATLAISEAYATGKQAGYRDGCDAGAAPFLDGPWWKRAWTAARS